MKESLCSVLVMSLAGLGAFAETFRFEVPIEQQKIIDNDENGNLWKGPVTNLGNAPITQVSVSLQIVSVSELEVAFNGDFYAFLLHDGKKVVLLNRVGRPENFGTGYPDAGLDVVFDDQAENGDIHLYRHTVAPEFGQPLTGVWQPDGRDTDPKLVTDSDPRTTPLSAFNGLSGDGEWDLFIADVSPGGRGFLVSWALDIQTAPTPTNQVDLTLLTRGGGKVSATPGGTNYTVGASVSLSASPNPGYAFDGWEGNVSGTNNPLPLVLSSNLTATARFLPAPIPAPDWVLDEEAPFAARLTTNEIPSLIYGWVEDSFPLGARVDPGTGGFSWTPSEAQGPGAYSLFYYIQDRFDPTLAITNSFTIAVRETNRPPSLEPISTATVTAGQPLELTLSAADPDLPTNQVVFSLLDAPAGAVIAPDTGIFKWTPPSSAETNLVELRVVATDDGLPSLSATQSFQVLVLPDQVTLTPPTLSLRRLDGRPLLSVLTTPGRDCFLETSTNLTAWTQVFQTNSATSTWEYLGPADVPRLFYRVRLQ